MEREIQKLLSDYFHLDARNIQLSKFFHNRALPKSKVLYFASHMNTPLALVKVARDPLGNERLKNEKRGQEEAGNTISHIKTPKIFFEGMVGQSTCYAEELVEGLPVGKVSAEKKIEDVYIFQKKIEKRGTISPLKLKEIQEFEDIKNDLYRADSHGDLTYMNVLDSKKGTFIIDWERFNERPIWGIDFVHYAIRALGIGSLDSFRKFLEGTSFIENEDKKYFEEVYTLDVILDRLQKSNEERYFEVIKQLQYE